MSDGTAWDADGSYPDLFACMGTDDDYACTTTVDDAASATWNQSYDVNVLNEAFIEVYDEDLTDHDWVLGYILTLDYLRDVAGCGELTESDGETSITIWVEAI